MTEDKSALATLVGADDSKAKDTGASKEELTMAAQDFIDAMKSGDPSRVAEAFQAMDELCESSEPYEPDDAAP